MHTKNRSLFSGLAYVSIGLILLSLAETCPAGTILDQLGTAPGGFWLGTIYSGPGAGVEPNGSDNFIVAQTFQTDQSYSDVTAAVEMYWFIGNANPGPAPVVSFYIAADDSGVPGSALASVQVSVTNTNPTSTPALYSLDFQNLDLSARTNYWLVASSDAVEYGLGYSLCCSGSVAIWNSSSSPASLADQLAFDQNSTGWVAQDGAEGLAAAIYGTPTSAPTGYPPPIAIPPYNSAAPEPSPLPLFGTGIAVLLLARRQQLRARGLPRRASS